jgi:hypothetical protein
MFFPLSMNVTGLTYMSVTDQAQLIAGSGSFCRNLWL